MTENQAPLESWKEIAAYLKKDTTTAQRWEKEEGLPVHRHSHKSRSSVYAYPGEIDAWRATRKLAAEPVRRPLWRIPAFAATLLLCLIMVGNGVRPVSAEQSRGLQARQLAGPKLDVEGSITSDGRYMAIRDYDTGDLARLDMSSGKIKRLHVKEGDLKDGDDWAEAPFISPDQKQIVYNWFVYAAQSFEFRIVANQSGAKPRTLIRNPELGWSQGLGWSKDGRSVLVDIWKSDRSEQLAWVSIADGAIRTIKVLDDRQLAGASLSPDGHYIVYSLSDGSTSSIHTMSTDGSGELVIVKDGINEYPVWTPDGTHALFMSNRSGTFGLWAIPVQSGKPSGAPRLVKGDMGRVFVMGLTSSGTLFYRHQEGLNNNYVADLNSATGKVRGPARMISEKFVGSNLPGAWSPDGKSFAFLRSPLGLDGNYLRRGNFPVDLVIHSMETGEERSFPSAQLSTVVVTPFWPPNSSGVLVPTHEPAGDRWVIHSIDAKTGEAKVAMQRDIHFPNTSLVPSPDGKTLYFPDFQDADRLPLGLFAVDIATGQRRQVYRTPDGGGINTRALFVSPDSKKIAFEIYKQKDAPWELCTISADGSGFREVYAPEPGAGFPGPLRGATWSPDSRWIFFSVDVDKGANSRLMRIPAEGGAPEFTGLEMPRMNRLALSPDGGLVAYSSRDVAMQEFWALDNLLSALKPKK